MPLINAKCMQNESVLADRESVIFGKDFTPAPAFPCLVPPLSILTLTAVWARHGFYQTNKDGTHQSDSKDGTHQSDSKTLSVRMNMTFLDDRTASSILVSSSLEAEQLTVKNVFRHVIHTTLVQAAHTVVHKVHTEGLE